MELRPPTDRSESWNSPSSLRPSWPRTRSSHSPSAPASRSNSVLPSSSTDRAGLFPGESRLDHPAAVVPAPISREIAVIRPLRTSAPAHPGRRSWLVETRNLAWQTIKQGIGTWSMLLAFAVALPALGLAGDSLDRMWLSSGIFLLVIAVGVSVFGLENRARSQRFLVHHGARPNTVWLVKFTMWLFGVVTLAIIFFGALVLSAMMGRPVGGGNELVVFACIPLAYAVALICGMAFRRGVTAFVIAVMLTFGLAWPLVALLYQSMMPWPAFLVVPAALIVVSWAWRTDWMLERPAPWRWLRLGAFACAAFALLFAWYIGVRAWGVPDPGPIAPPEAWARISSSASSPDRNAADLYREAGRLLAYRAASPAEYLTRNKQLLDVIRKAAARPECRFDRSDQPTLVDRETMPPWVPFVQLVSRMSDEAHTRAARWRSCRGLGRCHRPFPHGQAFCGRIGRRRGHRRRVAHRASTRSKWRSIGRLPRARLRSNFTRRLRPIATCPGCPPRARSCVPRPIFSRTRSTYRPANCAVSWKRYSTARSLASMMQGKPLPSEWSASSRPRGS